MSASPAAEAASPGDEPQEKYDLRYKLSLGEVLRYQVSHRASIRTSMEQTTDTAQTKTDSVKSWRITDVLPDGAIEFLIVVEQVRMVNQLSGSEPKEYDSERDKVPPPGFEEAARSIGVPLSQLRITPHGKVLRREQRLQRQGADEDGPVALRLPDKPVAVGDTWDEPCDVTVGLSGGGTKLVHTRRHYKLAEVNGDVATISVAYQILSPVEAEVEAQLVQRMMEGEAQFDITKGRVVRQQMDVDKRILGFFGPTSSMHYIMRMEEKLQAEPAKVASRPVEEATSDEADQEDQVAASEETDRPTQTARPVRVSRRPTRKGHTKGYRPW